MDMSSSWFKSGDSSSTSVSLLLPVFIPHLNWHFLSLFFLPLVFHLCRLVFLCQFACICPDIFSALLLFFTAVFWTCACLLDFGFACALLDLFVCLLLTVNLGVFVFIRSSLTESARPPVSVCGSYHFLVIFTKNVMTWPLRQLWSCDSCCFSHMLCIKNNLVRVRH